MSFEEVLEKRPNFDLLMVDSDSKDTVNQLEQLHKQGLLENKNTFVLTKYKWPHMDFYVDVFMKPLEIMRTHRFLANAIHGKDSEKDESNLDNSAHSLVGLRLLTLEDGSTFQFAGPKMLKSLGCVFTSQPLDIPIGDVSEVDVILAWIEQSPKIDIVIDNIAKFRESNKNKPIICITIASQPDDADRCLHAGATSIVSSPVNLPALSIALIKASHYNQK